MQVIGSRSSSRARSRSRGRCSVRVTSCGAEPVSSTDRTSPVRKARLTVEIFSSTDGIGGQMEDEGVDAKEMLATLRRDDLTEEERQAHMQAYAERMRA